MIDGLLCAKWKKPGYNRLCSVHVINSRNTNYGTTSICRVPRQQLRDGQSVEAQLTGCRGCCSGRGGYNNIFGNKFGQYLAAIQIAREEKAKETGDAYAPDKTKKDWQFAADYDENIAAKADAGKVAAERKKDPLEEGSWLGGGKKRKSKPAEDEEAGKRKKVEAEAEQYDAADLNKDGRTTRSESKAFLSKKANQYDAADLNQDGRTTRSESKAHAAAAAAATTAE